MIHKLNQFSTKNLDFFFVTISKDSGKIFLVHIPILSVCVGVGVGV